MAKEPLALILIMNKNEIGEINILEKLKPHLTTIVKHLVKEGNITTQEEFNKILDGGFVQAIRMEDADYKKLLNNDNLVAATAMDVYKANYQLEPNEDVEVLYYPEDKSPWGFNLHVCVMYSI
ncbi:MAG: hypothetical protein JW776_08765 [Candidatus Lokiarchaeota archaeon]|nr:hypothetical protein [Candidatus Lokiarchaeota archaeon]